MGEHQDGVTETVKDGESTSSHSPKQEKHDLRLFRKTLSDLSERAQFAGGQAACFGFVYALLRVLIILATLLAASTFISTRFNTAAPIISLAAAFLATVDTWLKPETKWKLSDRYNEEFDRFYFQLLKLGHRDHDKLHAFVEKIWVEIDKYREGRLA